MISTVQVAESVETPQTVQTIRDNISKALPQAEQYTHRLLNLSNTSTSQINNGSLGTLGAFICKR